MHIFLFTLNTYHETFCNLIQTTYNMNSTDLAPFHAQVDNLGGGPSLTLADFLTGSMGDYIC